MFSPISEIASMVKPGNFSYKRYNFLEYNINYFESAEVLLKTVLKQWAHIIFRYALITQSYN
jgi:hypothetical protein